MRWKETLLALLLAVSAVANGQGTSISIDSLTTLIKSDLESFPDTSLILRVRSRVQTGCIPIERIRSEYFFRFYPDTVLVVHWGSNSFEEYGMSLSVLTFLEAFVHDYSASGRDCGSMSLYEQGGFLFSYEGMIVYFTHCTADYDGRAIFNSYLEENGTPLREYRSDE
ncbi:MAG: hypothetical protein HWD92_13425 [Flavobacteriia bacterium]|nr:hypothetical protein [Flavobacteriia bacterium]